MLCYVSYILIDMVVIFLILLSSYLANSQNCSDFGSTNQTNTTDYCLCQVDYCDACQIDSFDQCHLCHQNFILNDDQTCSPPRCQGQLSFNGIQCGCNIGFYAQQNKCYQCIDNCLQCSSNGCQVCLPAFYRKNLMICSSCIQYCQICSSESDCWQCFDGFYFNEDSNSCEELTTLSSGVYQQGQNKGICMGGCKSCMNAKDCSECNSGFYLIMYDPQNNYFQCQTCDSTCKTCQNQNYCNSCYAGFYLSGVSCLACPSNCYNCDSGGFCSTCEVGYYQDNGVCNPCSQNCQQCLSSSRCLKCVTGYAVINQECTQCFPGCGKCSSSDIALCQSCINGYYLKSGNCETCFTGCKKCSSNTHCTACNYGYRLRNNMCYPNCQFPCQDCQNGQPSVCKSCYLGYSINQVTKTCDKQTQCNSGCQICPLGYILNQKNECVECNIQSIDKCIRCSISDSQICKGCQQGYALQQNQCINCPEGCETCQSVSFCFTCKNGYFIQKVNNKPIGTCSLCSSDQFCATCDDAPNKCTSCIENFRLKGRKCISNKYLTCNLQFDTKYSEYSGKVNDVKDAITQIIGGRYKNNKQYITTSSLEEGSVITTLIISILNGQDPVEIYQILSQSLNQGSIIGGLTITKANIQPINFDAPQEQTIIDSTPNLAIILGVSIPLGLIILILILFIMIQSRKSSQEKYQDNDPPNFSQMIKEEEQAKNNQNQFYEVDSRQQIFEVQEKQIYVY